MNVHKNARLTPYGRERIVRQVESGQTLKAVGEAAGVCRGPFANGFSDIAARVWLDYAIAVRGPSAASADASGGDRQGRASPPLALHWPADRGRVAHLASDRQPHSAPGAQ
jgi:hypothetical protein